MMLLLLIIFSVVCAVFYYCQALKSGLAAKRWALTGLFFGPVAWPMFIANKRFQTRRISGLPLSVFFA